MNTQDEFDDFGNHVGLRIAPSPTPDYFLSLMTGLWRTYMNYVNFFQAQRQFDKATYYQGKADATKDAIKHYQELKP